MADCTDYPTPEDAKRFKNNAGSVNEFVTLEQDRTNPASDGKTKKTMWGIENDATLQRDEIEQLAETQREQFDATFQVQFTYAKIGNISDFTGDTLTEAEKLNSYQYPDDSDDWYGPIQSQTFPITIPADPTVSGSGWSLVNSASQQWVSDNFSNPNLLSNHNFLTPSPDDITHPSTTPTDYVAGTQIFSGVFVESDVVGFTYINGRVKWTNETGNICLSVTNSNGLEYVNQFTASVADFDGKPRTRGVSFALVGDEYRVTISIDAFEDDEANEALLGSVKFEKGLLATNHAVTPSIVGGVRHIPASPTIDTAKEVRFAISNNQPFLLLPGVHYFKTTITNADGNEVFAELPDFTNIATMSKNTELRPVIAAHAFFTPKDVAATDIGVGKLRAFGVALGTTSPRLVENFISAREGVESRIVRFNNEGAETVDFNKGIDSYSWSSLLLNTDSSFCDVGYNFREGSEPPTSLRMLGVGATSCLTSFNIERITYGTMLNCFSDDVDIGVVVKQGKNFDIQNHGFEYTKQLFELGTDDSGATLSNGLNVKGAFVYQRVRKGDDDIEANYSDYAARVFQLQNSTLDFSGIDDDWFTRNKRNFLYMKSCFNTVIDGMPRECVVMDYTGDSTYSDITAGDKSFNLSTSFFVSETGSDENIGSNLEPFLSFDKVDFVLGDDLLTKRTVSIKDSISRELILRNKGWRKSSQSDDDSPRLVITGNDNSVSGIKLASVFGNLNDVLINNLSTSSDGFISDCTGLVLDNLTIPSGVNVSVSGGNVTFTNLNLEGSLYCQRGAQVRVSTTIGTGTITSAGAVIYASGLSAVNEVKVAGGQIFK